MLPRPGDSINTFGTEPKICGLSSHVCPLCCLGWAISPTERGKQAGCRGRERGATQRQHPFFRHAGLASSVGCQRRFLCGAGGTGGVVNASAETCRTGHNAKGDGDEQGGNDDGGEVCLHEDAMLPLPAQVRNLSCQLFMAAVNAGREHPGQVLPPRAVVSALREGSFRGVAQGPDASAEARGAGDHEDDGGNDECHDDDGCKVYSHSTPMLSLPGLPGNMILHLFWLKLLRIFRTVPYWLMESPGRDGAGGLLSG